MDRLSHRLTPAIVNTERWGAQYGPGEKIIQGLAKNLASVLEFEIGPRVTCVGLVGPEAEIVISTIEPPRAQLIKECRRLARYFEDLAQVIKDVDGDYQEENAWLSLEAEWFKLWQGLAPMSVTT